MASKARARKSRAVKKKSPSGVKAATVTPTYLEDGQTYTLGLHDIVRALKVIEKHGHMAKFVKAAKQEQVAGTFDARTVNFVKDFMVKQKMHNDPVGKHIVNAQEAGVARGATRGGGDRFDCNFG